MKKIIIATLTVLLIGVSLNAQTHLKSATGNNADTLGTLATKYLSSGIIKSFQKTVQVALYVDRISGTVSALATLQGSLDGIRYYDLDQTVTLVNAPSQVLAWKLENWSNLYLRVKIETDGTQQIRVESEYLTRREYQ